VFAEHAHLTSLHDLHADDRAHQRGLAAPAWAEQTRHRPGGNLQAEVVEYGASAAHDVKVLDLDCCGWHVRGEVTGALAPLCDPG
jgi:hypothetical protein